MADQSPNLGLGGGEESERVRAAARVASDGIEPGAESSSAGGGGAGGESGPVGGFAWLEGGVVIWGVVVVVGVFMAG